MKNHAVAIVVAVLLVLVTSAAHGQVASQPNGYAQQTIRLAPEYTPLKFMIVIYAPNHEATVKFYTMDPFERGGAAFVPDVSGCRPNFVPSVAGGCLPIASKR